MPSGKVLKGAVEGFLGTFTSRYSDVQGYWLFGFLVPDLGEMRIDLIQPPLEDPGTPGDWAVKYARDRFANQVEKTGLSRSRIVKADVVIKRMPGSADVHVNGHVRVGAYLGVYVRATLDTSKSFEGERTLLVAPHDPSIELRSARAA